MRKTFYFLCGLFYFFLYH